MKIPYRPEVITATKIIQTYTIPSLVPNSRTLYYGTRVVVRTTSSHMSFCVQDEELIYESETESWAHRGYRNYVFHQNFLGAMRDFFHRKNK